MYIQRPVAPHCQSVIQAANTVTMKKCATELNDYYSTIKCREAEENNGTSTLHDMKVQHVLDIFVHRDLASHKHMYIPST